MGLVVVPMLIAVQSTVSRDMGIATSIQFFASIGGAGNLGDGDRDGSAAARRLPLVGALHGVFVVGLTVSVVALAAAFLVPQGSARDLARAEVAASLLTREDDDGRRHTG